MYTRGGWLLVPPPPILRALPHQIPPIPLPFKSTSTKNKPTSPCRRYMTAESNDWCHKSDVRDVNDGGPLEQVSSVFISCQCRAIVEFWKRLKNPFKIVVSYAGLKGVFPSYIVTSQASVVLPSALVAHSPKAGPDRIHNRIYLTS